MTGTGMAAGECELGCLTVECRSVNGRALSVKSRLAVECQGMEAAIEERVRRRFTRGSVQVVLAVQDAPQAEEPGLDLERGEQVAQRLEEFAKSVGKSVTLGDILAFPGVVRGPSRSAPRLSRKLPDGVSRLLDEALSAMLADRVREGASTRTVMLQEVDSLQAALEEIRVLAPQVVEAYRDRVLQRVNEFLEGRAKALDPSDVIREVSLFADRVDISEEVHRLEEHGAKAREALRGGGAVGRRFEFLAQEVLREVNTLGSKSPDVGIAHLVVQMKSSIDKLKEQAANLE